MEKLKAVSIFSGCGGMDLGLIGDFEYLDRKYKRNPIDVIFALDNDRYAADIFEKNFSIPCICEDIRKVKTSEIPPHHILIGGFPCQSFSIVAQNPPRLGCKDEKGQLFFEMYRLISERKPLCFIAENVKGILSANKGKAFPLIIETFKSAGYHIKYAVLDSSDYGIPQRRERVFIVGFRDYEMYENFSFPLPTTKNKKIPLASVVFPESEIDPKYYFSERAVDGLKKSNKQMNKGRVQDLNQPCNTVGAHLAKVSLNSTDPVLKVNEKYRRFIPREVARIQSFPDNFELVGSEGRQYRALGNAVPPVIMWYVTRDVIKAIKKTDAKTFDKKPFRTEKEKRSYNMSKIKGKDTSIEIKLREELWAKGYRYRKNCKDVYGKPDIAFKSKKIAVFCDSSFWHGRNYEEDISRIKTNKKYWNDKILRNINRDKEVNSKLKEDGWIVLRFWDVDIKNNLQEVIGHIESAVQKKIKSEKKSRLVGINCIQPLKVEI